MIEYFDTPLLVFAFSQKPQLGARAWKLIADSPDAVTTPHALAECFNALTYRLGVPPGAAQTMISKLSEHFRFQSLTAPDYKLAMAEVISNGQTGDKIYDALHLRAATLARADRIYTSNKRDFSAFNPTIAVVKFTL